VENNEEKKLREWIPLDSATVNMQQLKDLLRNEQAKGETFLGFLLMNLMEYVQEREKTSKKSRYYRHYEDIVYDWVRITNGYVMHSEVSEKDKEIAELKAENADLKSEKWITKESAMAMIENADDACMEIYRDEIAQLKAWKEEAIKVMPDSQAIAKVLKIKLGETVHDKILPAIQNLQARFEQAAKDFESTTIELGEEQARYLTALKQIEQLRAEVERLKAENEKLRFEILISKNEGNTVARQFINVHTSDTATMNASSGSNAPQYIPKEQVEEMLREAFDAGGNNGVHSYVNRKGKEWLEKEKQTTINNLMHKP
jgi:cell division protein FtsB